MDYLTFNLRISSVKQCSQVQPVQRIVQKPPRTYDSPLRIILMYDRFRLSVCMHRFIVLGVVGIRHMSRMERATFLKL